MSAFPMRRAFVGLKARYHLWSGRRAYRVGAFGDAWAHFHKVIEHGYESFEANLALGKIYLRRRDFRLASRFFRRARAIDSRRYLLEGFPDDFIQTLQSEMPPGRRPEYRITISTSGPPPREPSRQPETVNLGDFANHDEAAQHRERPPLEPGEWVDVDWDAEARKLFED